MHDLSALDQLPHLRAEILEGPWRNFFEARTLAQAGKLATPSHLLFCDLIPLGEGEILVEAGFEDSQDRNFGTDLFFDYDRDSREFKVQSDCSCGDQELCMHAAAILIFLENYLRTWSPDPVSSSALDLNSEDWLDSLREAQVTPELEREKPDNRFLAYCLELPPAPSSPPLLHLHLARRLKSGEIRIDLGSHATADPVDPPKYLQPDDLLPCTLFQRNAFYVSPFSPSSRNCALQGESGHELLTACLETNRFFYLPDDSDPLPVRAATTLEVTPTWRILPDGSATPSLGLPPEGVLIPTFPPFALVPLPDATPPYASLHPVECATHSDALLIAWDRGPTIPGAVLAKLTESLGRMSIPLPTPPTISLKRLPKVRPVPRVTLHRKNPFEHRGLHLSGQPEPIVAELEFLYHDHVAPVAEFGRGKLPDLRIAAEGTVLSIPRHKTAELEFVQTLRTTLGIVSAMEFDLVPPKNRGCFLPNVSPRDWDLAWAQIIATRVPALEEQGWQVSIDTTAHIELHAIGPDNLDTGLAGLPEHGIDWFKFDPGYLTAAGEKHSLLPLLSAYLDCIDPETIPESLANLPESDQTVLKDPASGQFVSINTRRLLTLVKSIYDLFGHASPDQALHRIQAADLADTLELDQSETLRSLAALGRNLKSVTGLPANRPPKNLNATLRDYQLDGFRWMQFLARHSLHGILADDMGLGKTVQALAHLQAEVSGRRTEKQPSLVVAPTSVVGNWAAEARKFTPKLKVLTLHGPERKERFRLIPKHHLVLTTYPLLVRDFDELSRHPFHLLILDEAQYIKNPIARVSKLVCRLTASHRLSLSGTPLENHLGELWSQMRFLMPGLLGSHEEFRKTFRTPIEKHQNSEAQAVLNRRVAPLILRRTKEQVATELPPKTEIVHQIPLHAKQIDLYETVRAAMDKRVRDAIAAKGLAKSHIIVLDALLKLRQICCHPRLLKLAAAKKVSDSAKLDFLTSDLLPTLLEEGRRILLFSSFTSMLALIEDHLDREKIAFSKIIGSTTKRQEQIDRFQSGKVPIFLISLKAGGTGLNLTAADTVIHYDPWWNPAAENQATDRAHRIGQDKPVFVHKLIAEGTIEERILTLQSQKAALVEALLTDDTNRLRIDSDTLTSLLAPLS